MKVECTLASAQCCGSKAKYTQVEGLKRMHQLSVTLSFVPISAHQAELYSTKNIPSYIQIR